MLLLVAKIMSWKSCRCPKWFLLPTWSNNYYICRERFSKLDNFLACRNSFIQTPRQLVVFGKALANFLKKIIFVMTLTYSSELTLFMMFGSLSLSMTHTLVPLFLSHQPWTVPLGGFFNQRFYAIDIVSYIHRHQCICKFCI